MYKSKGSVNFIVHDKISGINAAFFYGSLQLLAEHVVSDLSDKCSFFAKTVQHGKNVTGSSARVASKVGFPWELSPFSVKSIRSSPRAVTSYCLFSIDDSS